MKKNVLILGAGFGGLELARRLSDSLTDQVQVTLLDHNDSFLFGFAKLEIVFGRRTRQELQLPYRDITMPGVEFRQEHVTAIDPRSRQVVTDAAAYEADILVVALGADYDPAATPGFVEDGYEYYSPAGAERFAAELPSVSGGQILIAILGVPFKCPPAPYEMALLLHDYLHEHGRRTSTRIDVISPMDTPIPVSPDASAAIITALTDRNIGYTPRRRVRALDPGLHVARTRAGDYQYDLFIGIPVHRVPAVVADSGLTAGGTDGWVAVDKRNLATPFPNVYALGDCADAPVPRAGVFAETAARAVADDIAANIHQRGPIDPYDGKGSCYIEYGAGLVGKVDADFLSSSMPSGPFLGPTHELAAEKAHYAATRAQRWFGRPYRAVAHGFADTDAGRPPTETPARGRGRTQQPSAPRSKRPGTG